MDELNFRPLSTARLGLQRLQDLFRKRPGGSRVLTRDQLTGTDNLRLWIR